MTALLHNLGLSPELSFADVYSISDPELLAFIPRPSYALLLVFPVNETYEKFRLEEDKDAEDYKGHGSGEEVLWFKQTIGNACGLYGLLHGVANGETRNFVG
jgi:ubiquitin carboxyl-terminal hydrolase L3